MNSARSGAEPGMRPAARSIVVGTAGHIDHGKTALVYALTGTDTDRLPEEKQRGITIDLGFAALRLANRNGDLLDIGLIDVPGHHAFIRNMLAGAGTIDCVMLTIAATEGVKAQTEEHLAICGLLGIRRGVVALTKKDAVSAEGLRETQASVRKFLQQTFLKDAPIVPVSAFTGEGIEELKAALCNVTAEAPERSGEYVPRLPLDRVFSVHGFGTVVTGTLQSGAIRAGDVLEAAGGRTMRVRGVQMHGESRNEAHAPCRVALNLADVEVADIRRGHTLVTPGTLVPATTLDVELSILPGAPALKHRSNVRVHAYTSDSLATVLLYGAAKVDGVSTELARLELAKPMVMIPGDRFVLRQCSPPTTIGGGRVLDAHPLPRCKKSAAMDWLREVKDASPAEQLRLRVARRGVAGIQQNHAVAETGLIPKAIQNYAEPLIAANRLARSEDGFFVATEALEHVMSATCEELKRARSGSISRAELKSKNRFGEQVLALAVSRLIAMREVELQGDMLSLAGRGEPIPEALRQSLDAIERIYAAAGLAGPLLSEVSGHIGVAPKEMHGLITLLLRSKRLVRMGADNAFVHVQALEKLYSDLRKYRGEQFDVGRFKSFTGLTRKHAIPLLEHLDQVRVTRNAGGVRVVL